MELETHGVNFLSSQDLALYYDKNGKCKENQKIGEITPENLSTNETENIEPEPVNIYALVENFIQDNPDGIYYLDEVPLLKGISYMYYFII